MVSMISTRKRFGKCPTTPTSDRRTSGSFSPGIRAAALQPEENTRDVNIGVSVLVWAKRESTQSVEPCPQETATTLAEIAKFVQLCFVFLKPLDQLFYRLGKKVSIERVSNEAKKEGTTVGLKDKMLS